MIIEEVQSEAKEEQFIFKKIENELLSDKKVNEKLLQWGLIDSLKIWEYRFNQKFDALNLKQFILDLLNSSIVQKDVYYELGMSSKNIMDVKYSHLRCNSLDLTFFDKLYEGGLVNKQSGYIKQCMPDYYKQIEVNSHLREMILLEESEYFDVLDHCDKQEFIWKLMVTLVLGGGTCQYEDKVDQYLEIVKFIYKNLVVVKKHTETQNIFIDSYVVQIDQIHEFFPQNQDDPHPQNYLYLIVNPSKMSVFVMTNKFLSHW